MSGGGGYELRIIYCENAKQKVGGGGPGPVVGGGGGQGGCEPRIEVIVKMQNKSLGENGRGEWGSGPGPVEEDQVGCEPRIEVIVKKQTKNVGGLIGGGGLVGSGVEVEGWG